MLQSTFLSKYLSQNQVKLTRSDTSIGRRKVEKNFFKIYLQRYKNFVKTPKMQFIYETFFYLLFLMLYSYIMLCKFNYHEDNLESRNTNETNRSYSGVGRNMERQERLLAGPSFSEYILILWIIFYTIDEFHQVSYLKYYFISSTKKLIQTLITISY